MNESSAETHSGNIGYAAVHPESGHPFCCADDACVIMAEPESLTRFVEESTGEPPPEGSLGEIDFETIMDSLVEGALWAFDPEAYARFQALAAQEGMETPPFDDIAVEAGDTGMRLGVLEVDVDDQGDIDDEDSIDHEPDAS